MNYTLMIESRSGTHHMRGDGDVKHQVIAPVREKVEEHTSSTSKYGGAEEGA